MANLDDATKITSGIALNTLVYETLEFVRQQLSAWRDDLERPEEESEEKLNSNLCDYLNYRAATATRWRSSTTKNSRRAAGGSTCR